MQTSMSILCQQNESINSVAINSMKSVITMARFSKLLSVMIIITACAAVSFAQPVLPSRSITVKPTQSIHFGTLCITGGVGGTVTVSYDGTRTSTGDVALLSLAPSAQPAIFEIKLCEGRNISISFSPSTTLTGSNGGFLIMDIGPTDKGVNGASFSTNSDCNFVTPLLVGGKLHVPGTALQGIYTGSFTITFNQQ